jgi:hypothetical protein
MTAPQNNELLARLAAQGDRSAADNPWKSVDATKPKHDAPADKDAKLDHLLQRVNKLAPGAAAASTDVSQRGSPQPPAAPAAQAQETPLEQSDFIPLEPTSFQEAGLTESEVEALILKYLFNRGDASGRQIAEQVRLPFLLVDTLLQRIKQDRLVALKDAAQMGDYFYQPTDLGRERGRRYTHDCTYFGAAPVPLADYIASVKAQSIQTQRPTPADLKQAFADLLISPKMLARLGPAINSGRGLFLYGPPGNGKTSIAERVTRAFGETIWLPRAMGVDGEIMRLYDPVNHDEMPLESGNGLLDQNRVDKRWVRIRRPTIIVGGELTMENLEVSYNKGTGIAEAPMQMKSNCGTLVIDDFGRQKMSTDQLLNRWIVPLEKRFDFLNLGSGKKIQVPFDQLVIFATNLEPRDLCDDAFLRRIPYKIEVGDPEEQAFRKLFEIMCPKFGIAYQSSAVDYLIEHHYRCVDRPYRCCQPRDLLLQVRNFCRYHGLQLELRNEYVDFACENYFAIM